MGQGGLGEEGQEVGVSAGIGMRTWHFVWHACCFAGHAFHGATLPAAPTPSQLAWLGKAGRQAWRALPAFLPACLAGWHPFSSAGHPSLLLSVVGGQ